MKYVLLFVDTEQFSNDLQAMEPVERDRAFQRVPYLDRRGLGNPIAHSRRLRG